MSLYGRKKNQMALPMDTLDTYFQVGSWKKVFERTSISKLQGNRQHTIYFDGWDHDWEESELNLYVFQITYHIIQYFSDDRMSRAIWGLGHSNWGNFSVLGLSWGPYYSFTHVYSAIFSNLIGKLNISNLENSMNGYWKTAWQGATGSFISGKDQKSIDRADKVLSSNSNGERLLGTWDIAVKGNEFSFSSQMYIFESQFAGISAEISWKGISSQTVLGNIYGNVLSFSCLWPDFSNVLTALCQVLENGTKMEGKIMSSANYLPRHQFGILSAHKRIQSPTQSE